MDLAPKMFNLRYKINKHKITENSTRAYRAKCKLYSASRKREKYIWWAFLDFPGQGGETARSSSRITL
jgi:hypothetical protein